MHNRANFPFDRCVGIVLLAASAGLFYDTFFFRTFDWDPVGMAFWPRVLLATLALVGVWLIVKGRIGSDAVERFTARSFVVFAGGVVYTFLLGYLGFFIATPLALFAYSCWLRPLSARALATGAVVALLGTGLVYAIFEYGMEVSLPRGLLG
jgi:putative tricarboxylic transport membrane protein